MFQHDMESCAVRFFGYYYICNSVVPSQCINYKLMYCGSFQVLVNISVPLK